MMLKERDVLYTFETKEDFGREYKYKRYYIPSGHESEDKVYCATELDFYKLLVHWTNRNWIYKPI